MKLANVHSGCGSGTVMVCLEKMYVKVCGDEWGQMETNVTCTQLGYSPTGILCSNIGHINCYFFWTIQNLL